MTLGALAIAGAGLVVAPAAQADGLGCGDNAVCFYKGYSTWTGAFHDVTSGYQTLVGSKGADKAWSNRGSGGTLLHFTNGKTICLKAGQLREDLKSIGTVDKVRLTNSAGC
ncbi:hypothetical protein J7F03_23140 [Streptomyces sp. ISL-43]|uniref:hypothetical protein n=1 Tax=Streptomyces sp. ISL-43 TaxID=2819183 RepID=UPI001BED065D|nr:hypothetical protein [Streptomyces sp. ISL-43]MBT2449916.1 hypothetical protein [Streptomyces sp. ISL-43]